MMLAGNEEGPVSDFAIDTSFTNANQQTSQPRRYGPNSWDHGLRLEALANLAHELRSPIQALLGYLDILGEELVDSLSKGQKDMMGRMNINARDLAQTVENVMEFAVADATDDVDLEEDIGVDELIRELAPALEAANAGKGLKIIFKLSRAPQIFRSNRHAIKSILMNLALNAIKFTEKGTVTVWIVGGRSSELQPIVEIGVSDTGPGIDAAMVTQAFEACTQLSNSSERNHRGMGLGLAVVQRNAIALKATVTVHSVLQHGSTFLVAIPLAGVIAA